jgi:RND family efflux transporter MFP subunit
MKVLATTLALAGLATAGSPPADELAAIELEAFARPHRTIEVGSASDGVLATVPAERGARVRAGDVLGELQLEVQRANLELALERAADTTEVELAEHRLAQARRTAARFAALHEQDLVPSEQYDETRDAVVEAELALRLSRHEQRLAELEVRRAAALVEEGVIRAPAGGVVVDRYHAAGEVITVSAGDPLVRIAQVDPLRLDVTVPAEHWGLAAVGDTAAVAFAQHVRGPRRARVVGVDRVIDAASGTYRIELELPNPGGAIPAGLRCRVRLGRDGGER